MLNSFGKAPAMAGFIILSKPDVPENNKRQVVNIHDEGSAGSSGRSHFLAEQACDSY